MKLVVTIHENSFDAAVAAVRALDRDHDMVEIRVDAFGGSGDLTAFRDATAKPLIFTNRGGEPVDPGFGFIDVEYGHQPRDPERTILSFHDFEGMPDLAPLIDKMRSMRCAYTKIAVTPKTLRENERILDQLRPGLTIFGMGERGLYSRILAPFLGSELAFVSVDDAHAAAPSQLSLEKALKIYGDGRVRPTHIFAIVGSPGRQSLSPTIHNPLFRQKGVPAAYTVASVDSFDEVIELFEARRLTGMSVTAPFKESAFTYAQRIGAQIGANARDARAANTVVATPRGVIADNTDVDGFEALLRGVTGKRAAVVGAGGTGRAALVALRRAGFDVTVYNRTVRDGSRPLAEVMRFDGEVVINTLPGGVAIELPRVSTIIEAAYSSADSPLATGHQLLRAQAIRQNELFLEAFK